MIMITTKDLQKNDKAICNLLIVDKQLLFLIPAGNQSSSLSNSHVAHHSNDNQLTKMLRYL